MRRINIFSRKINYFVLAIIIAGFIFRAYNLTWGSPYFFHPDERNVASVLSINALENLPEYLTMGTFSYGNFPTLYLQLIKLPYQIFQPNFDAFSFSTYLIRINSLVFSILTLLVIYSIGKMFSKQIAVTALAVSSFSVGLIQHAHFGTYDTFISFWILFAAYSCIKLVKTGEIKFYYFALLSVIVATTAKISSVTFLIIIALSLMLYLKQNKKRFKNKLKHVVLSIPLLALPIILSPYYLNPEFLGLIQYEKGVVDGSLDVFYTQSFRDTIPIVFQFTDIFPFLINPLNTFLFPFTIIASLYFMIIKKDKTLVILLFSFLILLIPQSILYAKWSRYMIPTLPFIYLFVAIGLHSFTDLLKKDKAKKRVNILVTSVLLIVALFYSLLYIKYAMSEYTTVAAAKWASKNIPKESKLLAETYDMGIVPFNERFTNIDLFDFYGLDYHPEMVFEIQTKLQEKDYIILPSQRVFKTRIEKGKVFPAGNAFYKNLFENSIRFTKIYETPCDVFCKMLYGGNAVYGYDETISVFDRPTVIIFKHNK